MTFEWDAEKNEATKAAGGLDFDYAATIFLDSNRLEGVGREKDGEIRYYTIGKAALGEILFVVFTWRQYENEEVCRIISARKAHKKERSRYSQVR